MVSTGGDNATDGPSSGRIRFEVNVADITKGGIFSPAVDVHGLPWTLEVGRRASSGCLAVHLHHRKSRSNIWSISVYCEFTVFNTEGPQTRKFKQPRVFNHEMPSWGFGNFCKWEDIIDEEKGYVKDGKITVEVRFKLSNIMGIRTSPLIDFTDPNEPRHDIALVINGEKIYVNKGILAVHSPVLNAMFYGNFVEKDKKEIELKDIDRQEFIEMLNFIYPSDKKITDENAEFLLKLADRFQIKIISDQVEQFFIDSSKLCIPAKLKLSDKYRLVKLQDHCLDTFKTVKDIMELKSTDGYKSLSNDAKATLLDTAMKLS